MPRACCWPCTSHDCSGGDPGPRTADVAGNIGRDMRDNSMPVGIFAASSIVPQVEFRAGVEHLRANGFDPRIESQVTAAEFLFPGSDEARANTMYGLATDPSLGVLWAARGGYGAGRLLPLLDRLTHERG